jgi:hypothetical protein
MVVTLTAIELVENLKKAGAVLTLEASEKIKFQVPKSAAHLITLLAQHKTELIGILQVSGGRVATFPHCPNCLSFALYRRNNLGNFACETCGLKGINEVMARKAQ